VGQDGYEASSIAYGGNGGDGVSNSITGTATYYGGGGGGAGDKTGSSDEVAGQGGLGGGGDGSQGQAQSGTSNTGGGGGGQLNNLGYGGGDGGSGVVIIRYPEQFTCSFGAGVSGYSTAPSGGFRRTVLTSGSGLLDFNTA
jgi:hypothetical protein